MATTKSVKKGKTEPLSKTPSKKVKKAKVTPVNVRLVSLTVGAVIPTQSYGNIQPSITVEATTIEEARALVMPVIEGLIAKYAETRPGFLGKVEVTEKVIVPPAKAPESPSSAPAPAVAPVSTESKPVETVATSTEPKNENVAKAEKAISLALTQEAVDVIQKQIENSTKIPEKFKKGLIEQCYSRWNALKK